MPSIIDPHPDWMGLLAQRIKAAAQSPQRWLALLSWLIELALARLAAFAGDVRALQRDKAFQRDLRSMVRFAEGMLRLAIRDAAGKIAFYRVHPNEALPARLRDHLAGLRLRPLRPRRPPHLPPRPPGFRVTLPAPSSHRRAAIGGTQRGSAPRALDPADAARSGMTQQEGAPQTPSSHRRAASGGIQKPSAPRALDPADAARSGMTQQEAPPQHPSSHRRAASGGIQPSAPKARAKRRRASPSSPASLLWRLLALQKAMPKLEKYAWRLAKAEARRALLPLRPRSPAPPSKVCSPSDPRAPAPHAAAQRRLEPG